MKLAIMQPYFMPYIGYFQLIKAVDMFVFYDDVNFIKQGWINRNNLLVQGNSSLFTIPLEKASSFSKINSVLLNERMFNSWRVKFLRTVEQSYKKAPQFDLIFALVEDVLTNHEAKDISTLAKLSIVKVTEYLDIDTTFINSTTNYNNDFLSGKSRVLDICKQERASTYINPIGGQDLYDKSEFKEQGIELFFINAIKKEYKQFNNEFVPWLSMIDILMFNDKAAVHDLLNQFELV